MDGSAPQSASSTASPPGLGRRRVELDLHRGRGERRPPREGHGARRRGWRGLREAGRLRREDRVVSQPQAKQLGVGGSKVLARPRLSGVGLALEGIARLGHAVPGDAALVVLNDVGELVDEERVSTAGPGAPGARREVDVAAERGRLSVQGAGEAPGLPVRVNADVAERMAKRVRHPTLHRLGEEAASAHRPCVGLPRGPGAPRRAEHGLHGLVRREEARIHARRRQGQPPADVRAEAVLFLAGQRRLQPGVPQPLLDDPHDRHGGSLVALQRRRRRTLLRPGHVPICARAVVVRSRRGGSGLLSLEAEEAHTPSPVCGIRPVAQHVRILSRTT